MILAIGPMPPPLHGASVVTEAVVGEFQRRTEVQVVNTAPRLKRAYHLQRLTLHIWALVKLLRLPGYASVYLTGVGGPSMLYQLPLVLAARLRGLRTTYHHHSYAYITRPDLTMRAMTRLSGPLLLHILLAERMAESFSELYRVPLSQTTVASNFHYIGEAFGFPKAEPRAVDALVLGHLSNLTKPKGLGTVLRAYRSVAERHESVQLRLAGPAADRYAQEVVLGLGEETRPQYHGPLPRAAVGPFLQSLDVFIFPSTYVNEAFPLVVAEALNAGTPVLCYAVGCLDSIRSWDGGWVQNERDLTEALHALADLKATDARAFVELMRSWSAVQRATVLGPPPTFTEYLLCE